jgi:hypothetical protein
MGETTNAKGLIRKWLQEPWNLHRAVIYIKYKYLQAVIL